MRNLRSRLEHLAKKAFGEIAQLCLNVIASAAKQSIFLTSLLRHGLLRLRSQ